MFPDGFILFRHSSWVNCLTTSVKRHHRVLSKVHPLQTALMEKAAMQIEENLLQAEIEFWRYMIQSRRGTISEQATERMLLACELAERKLMMMDGTGCRMETRQ
jgi:hypothetical protein